MIVEAFRTITVAVPDEWTDKHIENAIENDSSWWDEDETPWQSDVGEIDADDVQADSALVEDITPPTMKIIANEVVLGR